MNLALLVAGVLLAGMQSVVIADPVKTEGALPPPPPGFVWQPNPDLSDEFNRPQLDLNKWLPYQPYWDGRQPSRFDTRNVGLRDGNLQLKSTALVDTTSGISDLDKDIWIAAACVSSRAPIASYGYYEARIKASDISMTSSFWFQGKYSEIDVVEEIGSPALTNMQKNNSLMLMNTHYFPNGFTTDKSTPAKWQMPTGSADAYHVYAVWWKDKSTILMYHDGVKVAEIHPAGDFAEPMYLFFDTEAFIWYGYPTIDSLKDHSKNTMSVDWVRAWTLAPSKR